MKKLIAPSILAADFGNLERAGNKRISTREDRKFTIKMPEFTITKFD